MKCLVVGGGGFIGSFIVDALLKSEYRVRVFEKFGIQPYRTFNKNESIEWFYGDLLNSRDFFPALEGVDVVVNLVSTSLPNGSNENIHDDVGSNIKICCSILDGMRYCGVSRIVFISSGGTVYGEPIYLPIDESHPTDPLVSYGVSKLMIEKYLKIYHNLYGFDVSILRVSNPYGSRQKTASLQGVISVFLQKMYSGEPISMWGDGSLIRDFIYVEDVANAFVVAVERMAGYSIYNIGAGVGVSLIEIVRLIESYTGLSADVFFKPVRQFDVSANILDVSRARSELNWSPIVSLETGIKRTYDALLSSSHAN